MLATIQHNSQKYQIDLTKPIDISIPLSGSKLNVNAWYIGKPKIKPVKQGKWIGKVNQGSSVNFNNIRFNPHSHGTHTECVGHITKEFHSVNQHLKQFFYLAEVITVVPEKFENDAVISKKQLQFAIGNKKRGAIVIRTLPNTNEKFTKKYSHTNPPYLLKEAANYLKEKEVQHLLIDLPSIDKEKDGGKLVAHNTFWNTGAKIRFDATITELIFVPNTVEDGTYFLNIQIASFENDASPSRPVLYEILNG